MKFVDLVQIAIRAGHGGAGAVSFRREKFVPKGGPDGGNGGRGGDVVIRASRHLSTLLDFRYRHVYHAPRGQHGQGARKTGQSGQDVVLEVPLGTIVRDVSTGEVLADLVEDGTQTIAARGGAGGRGNAEFATATRQAPRHAEPGRPGQERTIELELKLLADIGLVGLPNAGKSTLISVISAARPKIADYPFTTLVPNLGIVRVEVGKSFVVADIPGLIEGAHQGRGLGTQFLRHIERTRVLVFLLDGTRDDVRADYDVLLSELRLFNRALGRKPRIVAVTKTDSVSQEGLRRLKKVAFGRTPVHYISAVAGQGIPPLVQAMWKALARERTKSPDDR